MVSGVPIDVVKLKALAGQNLSGAAIAKMLGCSRSGVYRVCFRHNIVLSGGPREGWAYIKKSHHTKLWMGWLAQKLALRSLMNLGFVWKRYQRG